jgi:hypothetical protein
VEELVRPTTVIGRTTIAVSVAIGIGLAVAPSAAADPGDALDDPGVPGPITSAGGQSDNADPAAVQACGNFAQALDTSSSYYGDFADALETYSQPDYQDPATSSSNSVGRTALRQSASLALDSANTPGLGPDIADPMRSWSFGATKLLIKMGLHGSGDGLNNTANEMNDDATKVQTACAAAGTHA